MLGRVCMYLEATADSCVEVRNLAEDCLVHFPFAIPTDYSEVRELPSLEEPRWLLARQTDRPRKCQKIEVVTAYLSSDSDWRTTTVGSSSTSSSMSISIAMASGEAIVRVCWVEEGSAGVRKCCCLRGLQKISWAIDLLPRAEAQTARCKGSSKPLNS